MVQISLPAQDPHTRKLLNRILNGDHGLRVAMLSVPLSIPRESILEGERQVSSLICDCSLGHTMALWEVVLGRKLEGEVVESGLKGSNRCLFRIRLPEEIVNRWT